MPSEKRNSDQRPFAERRARDTGITSGGRRKSDKQWVGGKKTRIAFAISLVFSCCILAWAFSLPFRGENAVVSFDGGSDSETGELEVRNVSHKSNSSNKLSNDEYVQWMMDLEQDLQDQLAEKRRTPRNLPNKKRAKDRWKNGLKRRIVDAKLLTELADGEVEKGTIEWHAQQDLKQYLDDAPE